MFYALTTLNALVSILLACAFFTFSQSKTNDIMARQELSHRAELIKVGDEYEYVFPATPLEPQRSIRYTVLEVKDGYVKYVHSIYPQGASNVERSVSFLKYKTKVAHQSPLENPEKP